MSIQPWPPRFQQWKARSPSVTCPLQNTRSPGSTPASSAASATAGLKTEPGGYWPETALLVSGARGLSTRRRQSDAAMPRLNALGSNAGVEASASTPPFATSRRTADALSPSSRPAAKRCNARSTVSRTSRPGGPSRRSSSRMTRPCALTSTWRLPAAPRSAASWAFSAPFLPTGKPGSLSSGSSSASSSVAAPT